ncbi:STAS domain-containing protein [Streptomyces dangxiongensis]|uniref:STAS domain-containing protein n=1 Tax=Streptomyces dangxiongensis TaxID=1442032 RepID=A0A3G2JJM5_9ACTN|nr:STAS domain-containing protein [Streptomyces dangxiongensis]AYN42544.1 STAS domain-containing protein [Streptomyces dangxiongensis]
MRITTRIDGTAARITVHGEIDHSTLPTLRATAAGLPPSVTELVWDLHDARFMDVAGLHLLFEQPSQEGPPRKTTVTNLAPQPLRLLVLAAEVNPALELARLLPDTPATLLDD